MTNPYLDRYVLPETYFALVRYEKLGDAFQETDPGYTRKECISDIVEGQIENPIAIYHYVEGTMINVTDDIMTEVEYELYARSEE